jgi:hypothetical protein
MTLGGGSVVAGSSEGSIDAGKGVALNGAVTQQVTYDIYGNPLLTLLPAVTTSGIRSASPVNSNILPGIIVLFAPRGVIDAGEAGIAGGNLYLDASSLRMLPILVRPVFPLVRLLRHRQPVFRLL